ncbi:MAG: SDR family NAD(P)-dependent oxidoreductase, partial [Candidatus Limnocylindrales bacterium]
MDDAARERVAVVTGAGRGLGRGVAVALARRGHPVVGVARTAAQLAETADLVRAEGGRMLSRPTDVSDPDAVAALATFVHEQLGPPSILVNAAGMFGPIAMIRDSDPADWVRTV